MGTAGLSAFLVALSPHVQNQVGIPGRAPCPAISSQHRASSKRGLKAWFAWLLLQNLTSEDPVSNYLITV